jgi:hypothetical protein
MTLPQYISIRVHYLWSELLKSFKFLSAAGSICWRPSFTCDQDARDVPCWILDIFVDFKQLLTCKKMDIGKSRSNLDQKMKTIPNLKISWKWFNMDPKKWAGMEKADLSANESELVSLETSRRCVHWKRQLWFHQAAYDHQSPLSNYYRLHWLPRGTAEGNCQKQIEKHSAMSMFHNGSIHELEISEHLLQVWTNHDKESFVSLMALNQAACLKIDSVAPLSGWCFRTCFRKACKSERAIVVGNNPPGDICDAWTKDRTSIPTNLKVEKCWKYLVPT